MASLKDMRTRIASVKATRKITKAMQMVAAAKLRRAQDAAQAARPYAARMDVILGNLNTRIANKDGASPLLVGTGKDQTHLLIVMTAERGLCGGFNGNIVKLARADTQRLTREGKTVKILAVGKKGADSLRREYAKQIVDRVDLKSVKNLSFVNAEGIGTKILAMFDAGEFDIATMYFSEFKSVIAQKPTALQLIPAKLPEMKATGATATKSEAVNEYEPRCRPRAACPTSWCWRPASWAGFPKVPGWRFCPMHLLPSGGFKTVWCPSRTSKPPIAGAPWWACPLT